MTPDFLRVLILVAVFAAVLLAMEAILGYIRASRGYASAINQRMRLIGSGLSREEVMVRLRRSSSLAELPIPPLLMNILRKIEAVINAAGLRTSAVNILAYMLAGSIILFLVLLVFAWSTGTSIGFGTILLCLSFAAAAGIGLPLMFLSRKADRRRKKLAEQFPVALDVFVRGLRAGHPVASALDLLTTEMSDPIGSEFGIVIDEVTYGADLRDALQNMADRCGVDDMQMFVVSLSIQNETGGNLAEILDNLSKVIRDRTAMLMKVRALSSEGRMTATMLTALPILAFTALFVLSPSFFLEVADDPLFIPGFGGLVVAFGIGVFWIRRLVDLKV